MAAIGSSDITYINPETGAPTGERLAWTKPASTDAVAAIAIADPNLEDGFTRSEWLWIRLANGDLILGTFPQDEAYFTYEVEASF